MRKIRKVVTIVTPWTLEELLSNLREWDNVSTDGPETPCTCYDPERALCQPPLDYDYLYTSNASYYREQAAFY